MRDDIEQLRVELAEKAAEVIGVVLPHTPDVQALAAQVVFAVTEGWSAQKLPNLFRDVGGMVHDGMNLTGGIVGRDDECVDVVAYRVATPARELNEDERAEREARRARISWRHSDHSAPPPPDTPWSDLREQGTWWITRDKQVMRLTDMAPSHRANLLAMLKRNALAYYDSHEFAVLANAPDDVIASAEREWSLSEDERRKLAWKWLRKRPLVKRLRKLVKADRLVAEGDGA